MVNLKDMPEGIALTADIRTEEHGQLTGKLFMGQNEALRGEVTLAQFNVQALEKLADIGDLEGGRRCESGYSRNATPPQIGRHITIAEWVT